MLCGRCRRRSASRAYKTCDSCRAYNREYKRAHPQQIDPAVRNARVRALVDSRRARGLCAACDTPSDGFYLCGPHRERQKAYRARVKVSRQGESDPFDMPMKRDW